MARTGSPLGGGHPREPDTIRDLPLREIDDSDQACQLRLDQATAALGRSLARDGQLEPIKVFAGRSGFRIIDGFRRTAAARELGWTTIRALVHAPMRSGEARNLAFVANVVRRELTAREKAVAVQMAREGGDPAAMLAALADNDPARRAVGVTDPVGEITPDCVRIHGVELTRGASPESRAVTAAFLRRALRRIEEFGTLRSGDGGGGGGGGGDGGDAGAEAGLGE